LIYVVNPQLFPCSNHTLLKNFATVATKYHLTRDYKVDYSNVVKAFLNASEVAKLLKVNRATVSRWIKRGVIKDVIRPEGSQNYRIPLSAYEELVKKKKK